MVRGSAMSWVLLSIMSALVLGVYDLTKKAAVKENAVPPVLFFSVVASAIVWTPFLIWSTASPDTFPSQRFQVQPMDIVQHGLLLFKAALVASSWMFNYFAVKHLPVSISSPIRATSPLWTILIAVALLGERPSVLQWSGIVVILGAFYAFTFVGRLEGIHFHKDRWVGFMIIATLIVVQFQGQYSSIDRRPRCHQDHSALELVVGDGAQPNVAAHKISTRWKSLGSHT